MRKSAEKRPKENARLNGDSTDEEAGESEFKESLVRRGATKTHRHGRLRRRPASSDETRC